MQMSLPETKQEISAQLEEALQCYIPFKEGKEVNEVFHVYLKTLDLHISGYLCGQEEIKATALNLWLDGRSIEQIVVIDRLREKGVTVHELRKWLFGDKFDWSGNDLGLVFSMYWVFLNQMLRYCPFCHEKKRGGNITYNPKTNGSVCPHEIIWEEERLKEAS